MSESAKDKVIKQPPQDDRAVPTLEEIEQALTVVLLKRAPQASGVLRRLRDLLKSGEYALITREDRRNALSTSFDAGAHLALKRAYASKAKRAKARTLLQLQETRSGG